MKYQLPLLEFHELGAELTDSLTTVLGSAKKQTKRTYIL
jgi:hypothetical protein